MNKLTGLLRRKTKKEGADDVGKRYIAKGSATSGSGRPGQRNSTSGFEVG